MKDVVYSSFLIVYLVSATSAPLRELFPYPTTSPRTAMEIAVWASDRAGRFCRWHRSHSLTMAKSKAMTEFGDFQTPISLARSCCDLLSQLGVSPNTILEPTCGQGSFAQASAERFCCASHLFAFDINAGYVESARRAGP